MLLGGLVAGAAMVIVLTAPRAIEPLGGLVGVLGMGSSAYCIGLVASRFGTTQALAACMVLALAAGAGGYALGSALLYRLAQLEEPPPPPTELPERDSGPVVLVCSCFEPPTYEPRYTAAALTLAEDEDEANIGIAVTPLLYTAAKARYRAAGGRSPSRKQMEQIAEQIEECLGEEFIGRVGIASCSGHDRLVIAVLEAVRAGSRFVVVAELAVGESLQMAQAKRDVDAMRLDELGVRVGYTAPLWGSQAISEMLAGRILRASADKAVTGVVLVVHGQNEERSHRNPEFDEHEAAFASRIRVLLSESGIPETNIRTAWASWREPDVTSTVRHLAALGCSRVLVVPATFPLETISTTIDLVAAAQQARVDDSVSVVALPAWRDEPAVIGELQTRIEECLGGSR